VAEEQSRSTNFFEYVKLAKQEYRTLLERHPELAQLSGRELEVLSQLLTDMTQAEIAGELYLSVSSIHFHCKNIYRKLNIHSRKQLLMHYKDLYK